MAKQAPPFDVIEEPDVQVPETEELKPIRAQRVETDEDDREALEWIMADIDNRIKTDYAQVFNMEQRLLDKARRPIDEHLGGGWVKNPDGSYYEDWSQLTTSDLEEFILAGSSEAFFASQRVVDSYAEASYAKFDYDDAYDAVYASLLVGTVGDKTAKTKRQTQKERWLALYKSLYYKKAKEVVDRLDSHVRRVERIYAERKKDVERMFRASRSNA